MIAGAPAAGARGRASFPDEVKAPVRYGPRIAAVVIYLLHYIAAASKNHGVLSLAPGQCSRMTACERRPHAGWEKGRREIEDVSRLSQSTSRMEPLFPKEQVPASTPPPPREVGTTSLSVVAVPSGYNLCFWGKNRVTHALMTAINEDRILLGLFLHELVKVKAPVDPRKAPVLEQQYPGEGEPSEGDLERRGIPDGWIFTEVAVVRNATAPTSIFPATSGGA
jgi:hypothetical protein